MSVSKGVQPEWREEAGRTVGSSDGDGVGKGSWHVGQWQET